MPFGGYFDEYYNSIYKPIIQNNGLTSIRADNLYTTRLIIDDIVEEIQKSYIVLADVTGKNPNVNYELGIAHALGKPVILITQNLADLPFDYQNVRAILYDPLSPIKMEEFKTRLSATIAEVSLNPEKNSLFKAISLKEIKHLRDYFVKIYLQQEMSVSKKSTITVDEQGSCFFAQRWTIKAVSEITTIFHVIKTEHPGRIEIIDIRDTLNNESLDIFIIEKTPTLLQYFILLKKKQFPSKTFLLDVNFTAEYYLHSLIKNGEVIESHHGISKSANTLKDHIEEYYFPNNKTFENLYAEILNHPDVSKIGQRIFPIAEKDKLKLVVEYLSDIEHKSEFGCVLKLNRDSEQHSR
jgi:hypothetical protein